MTKPKKEEIKSWEVILPVPLIIDSKITDEEIISRMVIAESESEASSILSSSFETPTEIYTIKCTESELLELLTIDQNIGITIELHKYDDMYVFIVSDGDSIIGRGEICESGKKINKADFKDIFLKNFDQFKEKFEAGQKRMNILTYKLKLLKAQLTNTSSNLPN